jgi:hypothetical protein
MKFDHLASPKSLFYKTFTPFLLLLTLAVPAFLMGCSSKATPQAASSQSVAPTAPAMGANPDPIPPQLVRDATGRVVWDRPSAFGPVPKAFQLAGNKTCATGGNDLIAIGYHPDAKNLSGQRFEGGGFYCFYAPK